MSDSTEAELRELVAAQAELIGVWLFWSDVMRDHDFAPSDLFTSTSQSTVTKYVSTVT